MFKHCVSHKFIAPGHVDKHLSNLGPVPGVISTHDVSRSYVIPIRFL